MAQNQQEKKTKFGNFKNQLQHFMYYDCIWCFLEPITPFYAL